MKIFQLSLCGITEAFPGPVSVDFEALGPGLIALVGPNGAGKSTLIGSIFAALFRQLPGQKRSLYDFCTHPKPEIDLSIQCQRTTIPLSAQDRSEVAADGELPLQRRGGTANQRQEGCLPGAYPQADRHNCVFRVSDFFEPKEDRKLPGTGPE